MFFVKFQNILLHYTLNLQVDGRHHRIPALRFFYRTLKRRALVLITVFPAVCAVENRIIGSFDPVGPHISIRSKTDHITGQGLIRIGPDIVLLQPHSFYIGIVLIILIDLLKLPGSIIIHIFLQDLIPAGRLFFYQTAHRLLIDLKTLLQHLDSWFCIFFFVQHRLHIQDHIINPLAGRQLRSVPVRDISPLKWDHPAVILLLIQNYFGILLSLGGIDISNPDHQNCKSQYRDHKGAYQLFLDWFIYFFPKWIFSLSYHAVLPA